MTFKGARTAPLFVLCTGLDRLSAVLPWLSCSAVVLAPTAMARTSRRSNLDRMGKRIVALGAWLCAVVLNIACATSVIVETGTDAEDADTENAPATCDDACELVDACLAQPQLCLPRCNNRPTVCEAEHQAWLDCLMANANDASPCQTPYQCKSALNTFIDCTSEPLEETCSGGGASCDCTRTTLTAKRTVQCEALDTGAMHCTCLLQGTQIGECNDTAGAACGFDGCCGALFNVAAP